MHFSNIERLVRRLRETGRVADRPQSGRPRVTSQRQDRAIRIAHLRNRHLTALNNIAGRVGEHPNEKDQCTGELHAKENQGGDKCERGTYQILTRCDFDFTIWGVPSKRL